jgi:hypothetical protein
MSKTIFSEFIMRTVRPSQDAEFLFNLLKERDSRANISHKKMPTYNTHLKFIESKPYKKWYVVIGITKNSSNKKPSSNSRIKIASVYLSKNDEIGIFVSKEFHGIDIGKFALNEIISRNPRKRYLANVSPKNKKSMRFFKNNNFKLIQYTFELDGS